jgi:hypothetical protein
MKSPKVLLKRTVVELALGRQLLKEKKQKLKKAKTSIKRKNAKLSLKTVEKAVENIEDHRELLIGQLAGKTASPEARRK